MKVGRRDGSVVVLLGLLGLAALPVSAQPTSAESEGQALAAELRLQQPLDNLATNGVLKMRDADGRRWSIPFAIRVTNAPDSWTATYTTTGTATVPAEQLMVTHFADKPNEYRYAKGAAPLAPCPEPAPLDPPRAAVPFGGSDFWLSDLGLEFFHWPGQRLVKREMRKGQPCRVLESTNPDLPSPNYARVWSWIDVETKHLIRAEAYNPERKLVKEFSVKRLAKLNGRYVLKALEIRNAATDSRTSLEFEYELPATQTAPASRATERSP